MSRNSAAMQPEIRPASGSRQRLVDAVVDQLTAMIAESSLQPGMKLPPEMKLSERLAVSRTVVREALQILTAKGLVETRHGVGTIIRSIGGEQISDHLSIMVRMNELTLEHLHDVRSILEVEIAGIGASRATKAEIRKLEELVERLEASAADPKGTAHYVESDGAFHRFLAQISHNPMLVMLLDSIGDILTEVRLSVANRPDLFGEGVPDHRRIMECVRSGDVIGAREAMRSHLERARKIQMLAAGKTKRGKTK